MKTTLKSGFILSAILLLENPVSCQWTANSIVTKANLHSISFCEDGSGWIVGNNGTMLYKLGSSWELSEKITDADLHSVIMNSEAEGWAVGSGGTILHFYDGKWTVVDSPTKEGLFSVSFKDPENGIAVGVHGTVIKYKNGRWQPENRIGRNNLYCVEYRDDILLIGGGAEASTMPIIKINERSGNKNKETFDPGYAFIKDIVSLKSDNIWAVGFPGIIYQYSGSKWGKIETTDNIPSLNSICFSDDNHGVAVGYKGAVMIYSVGKWRREYTPGRIKLNSVGFSGDTYYAVGNSGTILTYRKNAESKPFERESSSTRIPIKSYPNPTGDLLFYSIPDEFTGRSCRVIITNSVGQILYTRELYNIVPSQNLHFNTANLSNGSYFIRIESSGLSGTGKFIVKH